MAENNNSSASGAAALLYAEALQGVRKEILNKFAVGLVAGAIALIGFALLGWWLYFKPQIILAVGGLPRGAVVAFDRDDLNEDKCPDGWAPFKESHARVIVGVGKPEGRRSNAENGRALDEYAFRVHGGNQVTQLTIAEMPAHTHGIQSFSGVDAGRGGQGDGLYRVVQSGTSSVGEGKTFTNMPPFIALYFCKKVDG